jgi:cobalt/nickel transport system permease protein
MAHIPDGVLSLPVLATGAVLAVGALVWSLRRLDPMEVPRVAILTAMFFVASLVAIPVGPSSVHLLLSALMGLTLGWGVVPAVAVGLALQAFFFGFGGITALGVNIVNIAGPGLLAAALGAMLMPRFAAPLSKAIVAGGLAALAVAATGTMVAASLALSDADFATAARVLVVTYLPLMAVEGVVTGVAVGALARTRPDLLSGEPAGAPA